MAIERVLLPVGYIETPTGFDVTALNVTTVSVVGAFCGVGEARVNRIDEFVWTITHIKDTGEELATIVFDPAAKTILLYSKIEESDVRVIVEIS